MKKRKVIIAAICFAIVLVLGASYAVWGSGTKTGEDISGTEITSSVDDTDKDKADKKEEKKEDKRNEEVKKDSVSSSSNSSKPAASAEKKSSSSSSSTTASKKPSSSGSSSKDSGSSSSKPSTHTHTKATRTRTETETKYREEEVWHSADVCGCGYRTENQAAWSAHRDAHGEKHEGYRSWVDEWCTTTKKPYTVTHTVTETYCTSCGKVLSTSRS